MIRIRMRLLVLLFINGARFYRNVLYHTLHLHLVLNRWKIFYEQFLMSEARSTDYN